VVQVVEDVVESFYKRISTLCPDPPQPPPHHTTYTPRVYVVEVAERLYIEKREK